MRTGRIDCLELLRYMTVFDKREDEVMRKLCLGKKKERGEKLAALGSIDFGVLPGY